MSARTALAALITWGAPLAAWGQMPPFSLYAEQPGGTRALRQSLDEAWSVVSPGPSTKIERTEPEPAKHVVDPPAANSSAPEAPRVIRRNPGGAADSPREPRDSPLAAAASGSWMRTLASLAGVVAMILFLAWGAKSVRSVTGAGARPRKAGLIEIISRTAISQKQSVCLVRVGPRMVLIGVTPERLQALDVITDADTVSRLAGDAMNAERTREEGAFIRRLEKEGARFLDSNPQPAAVAASVDSATALRDRLKSSVARLRQAAARK